MGGNICATLKIGVTHITCAMGGVVSDLPTYVLHASPMDVHRDFDAAASASAQEEGVCSGRIRSPAPQMQTAPRMHACMCADRPGWSRSAHRRGGAAGPFMHRSMRGVTQPLHAGGLRCGHPPTLCVYLFECKSHVRHAGRWLIGAVHAWLPRRRRASNGRTTLKRSTSILGRGSRKVSELARGRLASYAR